MIEYGIVVYAVGLMLRGFDRIEVFASRDALVRWSSPIPVTDSTEWRSTLYCDAGGSIMLPPGAYRVEAYDTRLVGGVARMDWNVPTVVRWAGPLDLDCSGEFDDRDIEALWKCIGGDCCPTCSSDYDHDGDAGTDSDISRFYNLLAGRVAQ